MLVHAQQIEKRDIHIAVGGKSALYYLPLVPSSSGSLAAAKPRRSDAAAGTCALNGTRIRKMARVIRASGATADEISNLCVAMR